ncbi:hypothetical protein DYB35_013016 [Aphanomyces astaci]|uniref:DDE Tnp4 domain-containing protein n=1 Tax=Aphanomyces astaci TaxID=112090 RepID=A0A418DYS2_APHAT|nr:hypothetical protein DYB35_013016 [Aphanomyces astaci]
MVLNVAAMIGRLEDLAVSDQVFLDNCFTQYGDTIDQQEVTDSTCPIIDKVLEEDGDEGFRVMTNFTAAEFAVLWDVVQVSLKSRWSNGRGSKCKTSCKDALLMTLAVLKHYQSRFVRKPSIPELRTKNTLFEHYPYALYATDVKFQPTERPGGRHGESKVYFSGKRKLYGLKIEASVSPEGL